MKKVGDREDCEIGDQIPFMWGDINAFFNKNENK